MVTAVRPMLSPAAGLAMKLTALAWMVGDHVDQVLDGALGIHATVGRLVFPIFAVLVALNLTRADPRHMARTVLPRMLAVGCIAAVPYAWLWGWLPANVMFTLAAGVGVVTAWQLGRPATALAVAVLASPFVDYQGLGVAAVFVPWALLRAGAPLVLATAAASLLAVPAAGSAWPLLAVPTVWALCGLDAPAPRLKWLFYAVYPLHLVAIAAFQALR